MKRYNTIIEGAKEPENKNDLWIKDRKLKLFLNGIWKNIIGEADIKTNKEDLNINEEGNLELANREYEPSNFSGKGYKILRKNIQDGKNILTQEMINKPNLIYEIRYDFDLNGEDITIPEGCTLKFEGGKLSNGTLHGNNTKIIADSSDHIFNYDRTKNYIDGTWKINKWYCAWFGTVADGKAYRAKYDDSGQLVKDNADTYFEVIIEGTDNYLPIQEALDTAFSTNVKNVELGLGVYRICTPLNIGWGNKVYHSIYFSGVKRGTFGDIREANEYSTKILVDTGTYGICVNSGYYSHLKDFDILGWNGINYRKMFTMWQNTTYYAENPEDWNTERVNKLPSHGLEPMSPYAGIVTDAFINYEEATNPYELPIPPCNHPNFKATSSTGFTMTNVKSMGFCVGFGLEVGKYGDNADFYKFYNCEFNNNVYGVSTGSNQARNTAFRECNFSSCYIGLTNTKVGTQNGGFYGCVDNCWFDGCYKIVEIKSDISPLTFRNCYCENAYMIGGFPSADGANSQNLKFIDCSFRFISDINNPLGIPPYYFIGSALFYRCEISLSNEGTIVSMFMRNGSIVDCHFYTNNPTFTRNSCLFFNPIFPASSYYREIGGNFTNYNRFNNIWNYLGNNNFIITKNTRHSKELTHTSYSFNEDTGILELQTDWIGSVPSYDKTIAVGDLIYQFLKETIYVIVKIIPSEDNNNATVLCTPVCGFRKKDNKYICRGAIDNSRWTIFTTRLKTFDKPLVISSREDKVLTLREWDDTLKAGIGLSKYHDYEHSFQFEAGLIESVNKESKTITLKYNYHLDDTFKVINGYLVAEEDANFWKGTWVQDIINQYNNL